MKDQVDDDAIGVPAGSATTLLIATLYWAPGVNRMVGVIVTMFVAGLYKTEEPIGVPSELRATVEGFMVSGLIASLNWICTVESSAIPV